MYELTHENITKIKGYYQNVKDSCIFSVLEGVMGRAFAASRENGTMTVLLLGNFAYLSGDRNVFSQEAANQLIQDIYQIKDSSCTYLVPQNDQWKEYFLHQDQFQAMERYSLNQMNPSDFDVSGLRQLAGQLPREYRFAKMDDAIARQAMSKAWSKDFVGNFLSVKDFLEKGIGIAVMKGEELVSAASSYAVYSKGIEVDIATKQDYRRLGLASMCSAAFMLSCIQNNKIVHWDAANKTSLAIAKKLGFTFYGEYNAYVTI